MHEPNSQKFVLLARGSTRKFQAPQPFETRFFAAHLVVSPTAVMTRAGSLRTPGRARLRLFACIHGGFRMCQTQRRVL